MSEKLSDFLEDMALMREFTSSDIEYPRKFREAARIVRSVEDAPEAVMDTRDVLGICAPTEEDFPALYALQGKLVRLVEVK